MGLVQQLVQGQGGLAVKIIGLDAAQGIAHAYLWVHGPVAVQRLGQGLGGPADVLCKGPDPGLINPINFAVGYEVETHFFGIGAQQDRTLATA